MEGIKEALIKFFNHYPVVSQCISSANKDNIDDGIKKIVDSGFNFQMIEKILITISRARVQKLENLALFIHKLIKVKKFKNIHLNSNINPILLRHLYDLGDIKIEWIKDNVPTLQLFPFADIIDEFYSFTKLDISIFKLNKEWIYSGIHPESITYSIKTDDVDKLKQYIDKNGADSSIPYGAYELKAVKLGNDYGMLKGELKQIDAAAMYGSINCFKLLASLVPITEHTMICAVFGGEQEIIDFCLEKGQKFTQNCANFALEILRYDLVDRLQKDFGLKAHFKVHTKEHKLLNLLKKYKITMKMFGPLDVDCITDSLAIAYLDQQLSRGTPSQYLLYFRTTPAVYDYMLKKCDIIRSMPNSKRNFTRFYYALDEARQTIVFDEIVKRGRKIEEFFDFAQVVAECDEDTAIEMHSRARKARPEIVDLMVRNRMVTILNKFEEDAGRAGDFPLSEAPEFLEALGRVRFTRILVDNRTSYFVAARFGGLVRAAEDPLQYAVNFGKDLDEEEDAAEERAALARFDFFQLLPEFESLNF